MTSEQIDNLILEIDKKMDVTSIIITHDIFSVYRIAEKVVMLSGGKIAFEGSPDELRASNSKTVQEFIDRFEK